MTDKLIAKLERATEGSFDLDVEIAHAVGYERYDAPTLNMTWWRADANADWTLTPPMFTRSIDAALTLVPEGMEWEVTNLYGIARAGVGLNDEDGVWYGDHKGGCIALALCVAALKARQHRERDQ